MSYSVIDGLVYLCYGVYRGIPDFRGWLCRLQPGPTY